ncbi:MAG: plasma-membrane proton-efflux P-type ATPase [Chthoniobacter sp.]|nr:plasma-membrane proton-efflux P-type ATPase [Chthoniobacter sp.]
MPPPSTTPRDVTDAARGLSTAEAQERLKQFGPNAVAEEKAHPGRELVRKFWAPVPWLLEATIIIQIFLGEAVEASVIGGLLLFNAILSYLQESHTQKVLALLRQQLHVQARVRRDGAWISVAAEQLVPGDVLHLRQGGIVPADVRVAEGSLLLDQSALTGESAAVTVAAEKIAYAGAMVRGGEATGEVTATGTGTFFGKTAELVRTARSVNRQEHEIGAVVRNLFVVNAAMIVVVLGYAEHRGLTLEHMLPLLLAILLASIPVALPATFTLTAALGSALLSKRGVLITRLSALHDIASMTVLCSDKTGTLTRNEAAVQTLWAAPGSSEEELLRAAAMASDPAGQDPVDGAVVKAATQRGWQPDEAERADFKSFDPATKRAEAVFRGAGGTQRTTKGAPAVVARLAGAADSLWQGPAESMARNGQRVLAAAGGNETQWRFLGLLGLQDAVREDSRAVIAAIQGAGVRVVMVTGDNALTAASVAEQVGIPGGLCPVETLHGDLRGALHDYGVFAGVFPEDKFKLVRALQRGGEVVGMSGDGVNDAPALRQAEAGVAVANATDVAKAAAAIVLTQSGLGDVLPAIEESRRVFQRIMTYTLNMLTKKIELMTLLAGGFLLTGHKPLTPMMMVLFLFLSDFLTMSLSTDRMSVSRRPNHWNTHSIVLTATVLAMCKLAFSFGVFAYGHYVLHFDTPHLQTLTFATIILSTQAGIYLLRERGHFWASRPSPLLLGSSAFAAIVAVVLSQSGWLMPTIPLHLIASVAALALAYFIVLDWLKLWLFARLKLR